MEVLFNNKVILESQLSITTIPELQALIENQLGFAAEQYYLLHQGKRLTNQTCYDGRVHVVPKLVGGKGGFGSMLRAIGAQIEKTTNREACRDLSGRRLRDINEEQRLKNWIATQADREKEAAEKKKKKLERLCQEPKHEFKDSDYDKLRSALPEKVEDAVTQGLKASCSSKRKSEEPNTVVKKKPKLWFDDIEVSSTDDSEDEDKDSESKDPSSEIKLSNSDSKDEIPAVEEENPESTDQSVVENATSKGGATSP